MVRRHGPHQGAVKRTRIVVCCWTSDVVSFGSSGSSDEFVVRPLLLLLSALIPNTSISNCSVDNICLPPDLATICRAVDDDDDDDDANVVK